jgi:uncharacterized lipoprotein NlpE involved in copper resistance
MEYFMKKLNISSALLAILVLGFITFGCNENEDDPINPDPEAPNKVTDLMATSGSSTSVLLKWTTPSTSATSELASYELTVTPGGSTVTIAKNLNTYTVTGLTEGTTYTFAVKSKGTNGALSGATTVSWAPASRSGVIRMYGSAASEGSGVDLNGSSNPLTIANGGSWDLCFDDKDPLAPGIGSPGQSGYVNNEYKFPNGQVAKKTYVSTLRWTGVANLDQIFESEMLNAGTEEQLQVINTNQPFAFIAKTEEGNYAKVMVLAEGGQVIHGSGSNKYIEIVVSYQSTPNVPYALPKQPVNANISAGTTIVRNNATR